MFKDLKDLEKETKKQLICEILIQQALIHFLLKKVLGTNEKI